MTRNTYVDRLREAAVWRRGHARLIWANLVGRRRNDRARLTDRDHLLAAAEWLAKAQDACAGGVADCYHLRRGWASASTFSTARAVPTFLALEGGAFRDRAGCCVEYLLREQFENGSFADAPVDGSEQPASSLATAEAVEALATWHATTGDGRSIEGARRAADWLMSEGLASGAIDVACAAGALATLGAQVGEAAYRLAAGRMLASVLRRRDPDTGRLVDIETTCAIGMTLSEILRASEILELHEGFEAVAAAAGAVARSLELDRGLAGVLDDRWRSQPCPACLSGTAEMSLLWLRLYEREGDSRLLNAALKAIDAVKRAQPMFNPSSSILGGVPGSDPIWGPWHAMALASDAAEPFVEALLAKRRVMDGLEKRRPRGYAIPPDVPLTLPPLPAKEAPRRPRIVMYSRLNSAEVPTMIRAWSSWDFRPDAVVFLADRAPGAWARLKVAVRKEGISRAIRKTLSARVRATRAAPADPAAFCRRYGIPFVVVERLDDAEGLGVVRSLEPDLAIYAEAGILRAPLLAIPRLGTVNAHSGMLPYYRGLHTWAWSVLHGDPVGYSVHLMDTGIDTGDILVEGTVAEQPHDLKELWAFPRQARTELLGEVVRYIAATGALPPRRPQRREEGRQFFRMHPQLLEQVERRLREV